MSREFAQRVIFVTCAFLLIGFLWFAREAILLGFIGLLIGVILTTLVNWIRRVLPLKHKWALLVVLLLLIGMIAGGIRLIAPSLTEQFAGLADTLPKQAEKLEKSLQEKKWYQTLRKMLPTGTENDQKGNPLSVVGKFFKVTAEAVSGLVLVLFLGIFFAIDPEIYKRGAVSLFPLHYRNRIREVIERVVHVLRHWLLGQFLGMVAIGIIVGVALSFMGIPMAVALGVIAGLLEFVPFLGPIVSAVPALILAGAESEKAVLGVLLLFAGVQFLEGNVLTPLIQRKTVDMPPVLTLLSIVVMGSGFGVIGMFVATPLAAVLMVLVQELYIKDYLGGLNYK